MATQYSNKPIVTNGLVYALDFGNQKSYVSGSNSAFNLVYSTTTSSLNSYNSGQKGVVIGNSYQFNVPGDAYVSSSYFLTQALTFLDTASEYTVTVVVEPKAGNYSGEPRYLASNLTATGRTWGITYGTSGFTQYGINDGNTSIYSRQYPVGTSRQHVTYRYKSGSFDFFVNGVPVSASAINPSTFFRYQYGGGLTIGSPLDYLSPTPNGYAFSGSLGLFYVYNRALSSNEIYSNYLIAAQRYGLPTPAKPYSLDENAYLFLQSAGITDPIITSSINTFVLGLKSASLWDKMIAIYPFVGTGSVGVNLTGSHRWNLKEPSLVTYPLSFTGSWNGSVSGSTPSGSGTNITAGRITPSTVYPNYSSSNAHISILSYDTPTSSSFLAGTGIDTETAVSTLAGDYGTPAAAYSVRKVRTAYSGALMDVRRSIDNVTSSIGYVSNGDLDTGSLLDWVVPGRSTLPGAYSGLAAAYSLRRVSGSYTGSAIDVRRIWDNTTSSIGFDVNGNLDTGSLLNFTTSGSNGIVYSNDFTQGVWTKYNSQITSSAIIGPFGLGSGSFLNEITTGVPTGLHALDYNINPANTSSLHTISGFVKKQERRYVGLGFGYDANRGITTIFDLDTTASVSSGSVGTGFSVVSSSINYVTDGWFRISLTGTTGLTDLFPRFFLVTSSAQLNSPYPNYVAEPGTGSYVYGFQYTTGSTVQPYIETTGTARYNVGNTSSFGYVAQWYDQSGNNRHATQTTASSQPLIVSSGSLVTEGTKPAVKFYTNLGMDTGFTGLVTKSLFIAANTDFGLNRNDAAQRLFSSYAGTAGVGSELVLSAYGTSSFAYEDGGASLTVSQTASYQLTTAIRNSTLNLAFNGGSITSGGSPSSNPNTRNYRIGEDGGASSTETAKSIQEVIFYNNDQSTNRPLIENNINNYYSIYTGSNNGFVARWYDQSGNNRHATQTATGSQPIIVLSGSVVLDNNRSALSFIGSSLNFNLQWVNAAFTTYGVINAKSLGYRQFLGEGSGSNGYYGLAIRTSPDRFAVERFGQSAVGFTSVPIVDTQYLTNYYSTGLSGGSITTKFRKNNGVEETADITISFTDDKSVIGRVWNGNIQELILYKSYQVDQLQPINYGINNYYNIYPQTSSFTTSSFTIKATPTGITGAINNQPLNGISSTGPVGFITVSRTGSNSLSVARNSSVTTFTTPSSGALSTGIYLGASNYNGITVGSSPLGISFASVGTGLTNTELRTYEQLVSSLYVNLGRNDIDASAFIDAAQITSPVQISAINTLVRNLKAYNIWPKLKAVYPFVGGTSGSHKFNLIDPRDLDAAYRLTFSGSWSHTSLGLELLAANAYADTYLIPSQQLSQNSKHMMMYQRNNLSNRMIGTPSETDQFQYAFGTFNYNLSSGGGGYSAYPQTNTGFLLTSRIDSTKATLYRNGIFQQDLISTSTINTTGSYRFGEFTNSSYGTGYFSFGSFGDGLTATEVANYYTAVQAFQTALGRQL